MIQSVSDQTDKLKDLSLPKMRNLLFWYDWQHLLPGSFRWYWIYSLWYQ